MLRYLQLIVPLFLLSRIMTAQVIVGQANCTYYHKTYSPPLSFSAGSAGFANYYLDLDKDGLDDIRVYVFNSGGLGGNSSGTSVYFYNGCEIAYDHTDTSYYQNCSWSPGINDVPKVFSPGDTLSDFAEWKNSGMTLANSGYLMSPNSPPCNYNYPGISGTNVYIGLRLVTVSDTVYGWIKFSQLGVGSFSVEEVASNAHVDSIPVSVGNPLSELNVDCKQNLTIDPQITSLSACTSISWYKDSVLLPNRINDTLKLGIMDPAKEGYYQCLIETPFDTLIYSVIVKEKRNIHNTIHDSDISRCFWYPVSIVAEVEVEGSYSGQWLFNYDTIPGENTNYLWLGVVTDETHNGVYQYRIINGCNDTVVSNIATLQMVSQPYPVITREGARLYSNYDTGNHWYRIIDEFNNSTEISQEAYIDITDDGLYFLRVHQACDGESSIYTAQLEFEIYPNPMISELNLILPSSEYQEWILYNELGVKVQTGSAIPGMNKIDVSERSPGIYFIIIDGKAYKLIKPIVK